MKKKYTKKQIMESIKYWQKQLKRMNESIDEDIVYGSEIDDVLNELIKAQRISADYAEWCSDPMGVVFTYELVEKYDALQTAPGDAISTELALKDKDVTNFNGKVQLDYHKCQWWSNGDVFVPAEIIT